MGNVLDAILKKVMLEGPETVNTDFYTEMIDIDGREAEFAIQFTWDNGTAVNMDIFIEVSVNGVIFAEVDDSRQPINSVADSHIWDMAGTGASYLRVGVEVTAGSIDIQEILAVMRRRH
jgi:hypothetical protein